LIFVSLPVVGVRGEFTTFRNSLQAFFAKKVKKIDFLLKNGPNSGKKEA
jgi:hypothetical protein